MEGRRLEMGSYVVTVATSFGPRIVEFGFDTSPPLFARLSDHVVLEHPDSGVYRFRGGHRLWAAPEIPAISYASDDHPCRLDAEAGTTTLTGPVDAAGLIKTMEMRATDEGLVVDHTLSAPRGRRHEVAAWAITQLRLGGVALLPVNSRPPGGPQASASIVLWPYTDLADSRLGWEGRGVSVRAEPGPPLKIGVGPNPGRIGYLIDDHLFMKQIRSGSGRARTDRGAVAEVYVNQDFVELESLGSVVAVGGEVSASQREVWTLRPCDGPDQAWEWLWEDPPG